MRAAREVISEAIAEAVCEFMNKPFDTQSRADRTRRLQEAEFVQLTLQNFGFAIVPIEPSEKMRMEAWNAWVEMWPSVEPLSQEFFDGVYRAHLKASLSEG